MKQTYVTKSGEILSESEIQNIREYAELANLAESIQLRYSANHMCDQIALDIAREVKRKLNMYPDDEDTTIESVMETATANGLHWLADYASNDAWQSFEKTFEPNCDKEDCAWDCEMLPQEFFNDWIYRNDTIRGEFETYFAQNNLV